MTIVVTDNCRLCRFTECVSVCPVECFHSDDTMVYIDNDVCIDCTCLHPGLPGQSHRSQRRICRRSKCAGWR